jgi:hypothetical protein
LGEAVKTTGIDAKKLCLARADDKIAIPSNECSTRNSAQE